MKYFNFLIWILIPLYVVLLKDYGYFVDWAYVTLLSFMVADWEEATKESLYLFVGFSVLMFNFVGFFKFLFF